VGLRDCGAPQLFPARARAARRSVVVQYCPGYEAVDAPNVGTLQELHLDVPSTSPQFDLRVTVQ